MFGAGSDNDLVDCPYNKAHRVLKKRLQIHLLRCRKNYPDVELQKCPFNVTHLIPEPEFVNHVVTCPDRKLVTQYKYKDEDDKKTGETKKYRALENEENWDE